MTLSRDRMSVEHCRLIQFPTISDARGSLSVIEAARHVPFEIKRVFYLYGVPPGETRGGHAHKTLHQVMVCLAGGFDILLDDGSGKRRVRLDSPGCGLHVPPMVWDTEVEFEPGSVCLVLASAHYDEADYYRSYDDFLREVAARQSAQTG